jgi:DNA adenine methylase
MIPFLKWPGGKRWFVANHSSLFPVRYGRYVEPFLGDGSVYFHLQPKRALLGDINEELIATYVTVRDHWRSIVKLLNEHQAEHSKKHYYRTRKTEPKNPIEMAARFIYLNRTCFNGIYRVNRLGEFNVPKGTKNTVVLDDDDFRAIASQLQTAEIRKSDFEDLIDEAIRGDFVFADPPYTVSHSNNGFIKYNEKLFSWGDQIRLSGALTRARDRGVNIVLTNANHGSVRELYTKSGFAVRTVSRFSSISADAQGRKQFEELIAVASPKRISLP